MPFLENLRRQRDLKAKEAEEVRKSAIANADRQRELLARAEDQRKRLELERKNQIERQIKQAEARFAKSEFTRLSKELALVVGDIILVKGEIATQDKYDITFGASHILTTYSPYIRDNSIHDLSQRREHYLNKRNPFSQVGISLIWMEEISRRWIPEDTTGRHRYEGSYYAWQELYSILAIGCNPLGEITLRTSRRDIKLPMSKWFGNPAIQEEALGRGYNNPKQGTRWKNNIPPKPSGPEGYNPAYPWNTM